MRLDVENEMASRVRGGLGVNGASALGRRRPNWWPGLFPSHMKYSQTGARAFCPLTGFERAKRAGCPRAGLAGAKCLGGRRLVLLLAAAVVLAASGAIRAASAAPDPRSAFISFTEFSRFTRSPGARTNEVILLSPEITAPIAWDELVLSWNVPPGVYLKAEARALYPERATRYYTLGQWSDDPARFPRRSVPGQRDADGEVRMDTLALNHAARRVQLRLTVGGAAEPSGLKFLGVSFCNTAAPIRKLAPNRAAWGKVLPVPERRQGEYEGGGGWCSPTSLSMVLAYWGERLQRPELNYTVPETARAIADGPRADTGNWPFNTAFAGRHPGLRAYVTRLGDIAEMEDWIAAGIPVILSVSSYLTRSPASGPDYGHLIVCVGFTDTGDVVANNPGVSVRKNVRARQVYAREQVVRNWARSKNTVYLIYPETAAIPANRLGHWDDGSAAAGAVEGKGQ